MSERFWPTPEQADDLIDTFLDSEEAVKELAEVVFRDSNRVRQHDYTHPDCGVKAFDEAAANKRAHRLLTAWRNLRREGK